MFVEILETQRLALGNKHRHTLASMYGLARLYTAQDRYEEAENLFTEMLEIAPTQLGEEHPDTLGFMNGFAVLLTKQKRYDEAEALFNKVLSGRRQKLDEDHPDTLESKHDLAMLHKEQGLYDKAEPLLIEALKGRRLKLGDTHPHTQESMKALIELYQPGTNQKKPKSGEQNCRKQMLWNSDTLIFQKADMEMCDGLRACVLMRCLFGGIHLYWLLRDLLRERKRLISSMY